MDNVLNKYNQYPLQMPMNFLNIVLNNNKCSLRENMAA